MSDAVFFSFSFLKRAARRQFVGAVSRLQLLLFKRSKSKRKDKI